MVDGSGSDGGEGAATFDFLGFFDGFSDGAAEDSAGADAVSGTDASGVLAFDFFDFFGGASSTACFFETLVSAGAESGAAASSVSAAFADFFFLPSAGASTSWLSFFAFLRLFTALSASSFPASKTSVDFFRFSPLEGDGSVGGSTAGPESSTALRFDFLSVFLDASLDDSGI
jgi:hypothetical protein